MALRTPLTYPTALITGASSGLGAALARRLARGGTRVVIAARRAAELDALAHEITAQGGSARALVLDVADTTATVAAIRAVDAEESGLDLIVANAGLGEPGPPPVRWEDIERMVRVNFDGALATLSAVLPEMVARDRGHLVGVSSLAGLGPLPQSAAYCATKAGLSMYLASLRLDLLGTHVYATAVHPGFVRTPLTDRNRFPMPFLMELEPAIDAIMRRLPRAPASIAFPRPLSTAAWAGGLLPTPVRDLVIKRQRVIAR